MDIHAEASHQVPFAREIRREARIATGAVGLITSLCKPTKSFHQSPQTVCSSLARSFVIRTGPTRCGSASSRNYRGPRSTAASNHAFDAERLLRGSKDLPLIDARHLSVAPTEKRPDALTRIGPFGTGERGYLPARVTTKRAADCLKIDLGTDLEQSRAQHGLWCQPWEATVKVLNDRERVGRVHQVV